MASLTPTPAPVQGPITQPITTVAQAGAAGAYDSTHGTGAYARQSAPAAPPAPAAPGTPANNNPIAGSDVRRYTGSDISSGASTTPAPQDDSVLRANELSAVQGRIDSINSNFTTNLAQTQENNANLVGGQRARDARGGLLGSDFGAANEARASAKADANITKVQQGHDKDLNTIYDSINKDISAKQKAYETQQGKLTASQTKAFTTNAQGYVKNLAKTGGTLDSLTQDEYNHIVEASGMNDDELHALYAANVPQDKILKQTIQGGQYIQVTKNPATGAIETNVVPLPDTVPPDYVPIHLPSGELAFMPKGGLDPTKPNLGIIPYTGVGSTPKSGTKADTTADQKKVSTDLSGAQDAITNGADPVKVRQRFIETHPKQAATYDKYMNPPKKTTGSGTGSGRSL